MRDKEAYSAHEHIPLCAKECIVCVKLTHWDIIPYEEKQHNVPEQLCFDIINYSLVTFR